MKGLNSSTWIDWQYLFVAASLLAKCRYTLQYTYPYAYYMEASSRKDLFEYQQVTFTFQILAHLIVIHETFTGTTWSRNWELIVEDRKSRNDGMWSRWYWEPDGHRWETTNDFTQRLLPRVNLDMKWTSSQSIRLNPMLVSSFARFVVVLKVPFIYYVVSQRGLKDL